MLLHPVGKIKGVIQFEALEHIKPSAQNNLPAMVRCDVAVMFCTGGVISPGELNPDALAGIGRSHPRGPAGLGPSPARQSPARGFSGRQKGRADDRPARKPAPGAHAS